MSKPIRIPDELYDQAQKQAKAEFRSVPQQIDFWARVGKCALENPDLPIEFVRDILISRNEKTEPFQFRSDTREKNVSKSEDILVEQTPTFKKVYKKLSSNEANAVEQAIKAIYADLKFR